MGIIESIAEQVIRSKLVPMIKEYAGENCKELRLCILLNIDLLGAYEKQGTVGGVSVGTVRDLAKRFPQVEKIVSFENVMRWLREDTPDVAETLETTAGGMLWLDMQITRVRREFFG